MVIIPMSVGKVPLGRCTFCGLGFTALGYQEASVEIYAPEVYLLWME